LFSKETIFLQKVTFWVQWTVEQKMEKEKIKHFLAHSRQLLKDN